MPLTNKTGRYFFLLSAFVMFAGKSIAQSDVTASVAEVRLVFDAKHPTAMIGQEFAGLSFEAARLLPDASGHHYFCPENQALISLFRTLGIRNLRIGGNTSDRDARQLPGPADWEPFFAFARAAGVKVIYGLQLYKGDPQVDARTAKYLSDHYAPLIECFAIGQEPSAYPVGSLDNHSNHEPRGAGAENFAYQKFALEWERFAGAILAAVPNAKLCGPSVHNNGKWTSQFIADFGHSNQVAIITSHLYAGGAGDKVATPESGREQMLSNRFLQTYQKLFDGFVPFAVSNGLPYRLEEANSFYNAGAAGVSDTFASALWSLDFMCWWAEHGAAGVNFHTGDQVAAGPILRPANYAVFLSCTNGYRTRPVGYGLKAFNLMAGGSVLPMTITNPRGVNLSAYAVLGTNDSVFVTLINKEHGAGAKNLKVQINPAAGHLPERQVMFLTAPNNDISATAGQTLGGGEISDSGEFSGRWQALQPAANNPDDKSCTVELPPASAAIVMLKAGESLGMNASR